MTTFAICIAGVVVSWIAFALFAKKKAWSKTISIGGGFIVSMLFFCVLGLIFLSPIHQSPPLPTSPQLSLEVGKIYKFKAGYPVARYPAVVEQAINLQNDTEAYKKFLAQGDIALTPANVQVYFLDLNFGGIIKVRPKGEIAELWTIKESLEPL